MLVARFVPGVERGDADLDDGVARGRIGQIDGLLDDAPDMELALGIAEDVVADEAEPTR